ncbi:MAG: methylmalonyl Co-A mutase-associated GTPase MeaB [SAR324 cluster bacterium]|uniref:Methylmalonyl Co-A mutase-associated GTPase MeaB n=1 Tax=SAR324 cluster bacterium TaxID=2024889 RepID=A0A7X9FPN6_9DELT|nr:methylmalonyl Co-A mutase-associated GTPase MeaB [SAR324 cluster bacterium]
MKRSKPEWAPEKDGRGVFASSVLEGLNELRPRSLESTKTKRQKLSVEEYVKGVLSGDRSVLARAITLVESNALEDQKAAQELLQALLPHSGRSIRIGLSGIPGAGKSTFIEAFGTLLCEAGHKVAVLAVDPSSSKSKGSILGDKTRMEKLSQHPGSFIRPSPSGGVLGGVARKTRESIVVCEAAGLDIIIIETVGVGQSEASVRSMVDFFILLTIAGAGDEMQHIKRGVLELADAVVVNKADGENLLAAQRTQAELKIALHYAHGETKEWKPESYLCSALDGSGISDIWELIKRFDNCMTKNGQKERRRKEQLLYWTESLLFEELRQRFLRDAQGQARYELIKKEVLEERISPVAAVDKLMSEY